VFCAWRVMIMGGLRDLRLRFVSWSCLSLGFYVWLRRALSFMYKFSEMTMLLVCGRWLFGRHCVGGAMWLHLAYQYASCWSIDLLACLLA
jgi:hypothetical protein